MKMKMYLLSLMLFSVLGVSAQTVYVNKISMKYHNESCIKVNDKYYTISLKEALNAGCTPCKECSPLTKIVNENSDLPLEFTKVIYTDSVGKVNLFVTLNEWFATNFKSANDVIQMADKEAGVIIGKGNFEYSYGQKLSYVCYSGHINFTIKIYIKDNRYKVEFLNFSHESSGSQYSSSLCTLGLITSSSESSFNGLGKSFYNNVWRDVQDKINLKSEIIFNSLELKTKNIKILDEKDGW